MKKTLTNDLINKNNSANNKDMNDSLYYKWEPDDRFVFTGEEFALLSNSLKRITENPEFTAKLLEAQNTLSIASLQELVNKKMEAYAATGQVRKLNKKQMDMEQAMSRNKEFPVGKKSEPILDRPLSEGVEFIESSPEIMGEVIPGIPLDEHIDSDQVELDKTFVD